MSRKIKGAKEITPKTALDRRVAKEMCLPVELVRKVTTRFITAITTELLEENAVLLPMFCYLHLKRSRKTSSGTILTRGDFRAKVKGAAFELGAHNQFFVTAKKTEGFRKLVHAKYGTAAILKEVVDVKAK